MNDNPYEQGVTVSQVGAVQVEGARAVAEVKAQVIMARQYPRDPVQATDRILAECDRSTLAEKAIYSFPKGGQQITGPSIRLAESIARHWGNIAAGVVEIERIGEESAMLAYAWDLETNTMIRKEFRVPHTRDTKQGKKTLTDDRDIYEMTANQGARRLRSCILALIPGDVVDAAVSRAEKTLVAKIGDVKEASIKMLDAFASMGVTKLMIEKRLRHRIDSIQAAEIVTLKTVYASIRDGMGQVTDYFEGEPKEPEQVIKPAKDQKSTVPAPASTEPEFALDGTPPVQLSDIMVELEEYEQAESTPVAARGDIQNAFARKETDIKKLTDLLNRVKTACKK